MSRKVCLYHRSDLDGHCSGAICKLAMPDVILHGVEYGDQIPWDLIGDSELFVLDWSFQPWEIFEKAIQRAYNVTWIDHHKSAIEEWETHKHLADQDKVTTVLDTSKAACELAWEYLFSEQPMPEPVRLLGRYDVWDHQDSRVLPYQYRMRAEDTDPKDPDNMPLWSRTLNGSIDIDRECEKGHLILKYQVKQDARAVSGKWSPVFLGGMWWQACNHLGRGSKLFDSVRDKDNYHGVLSFGWNGEHWVMGLYSDRDDVDCSAIARKHGGGGHKGAAGFICRALPFELNPPTKKAKSKQQEKADEPKQGDAHDQD